MAVKTFTTGEVLTAADTNTYLANSGLDYIGAVTATSGSTIQVDNVFSANYDSYRVVVSQLRMSTTASGVNFRLRNSGGTSNASYYYGGLYLSAYGNTTVNATTSANASSIDMNTVGGTTDSGFAFDIFGPFVTQRTTLTMTGSDCRTAGAPRMSLTGFHDVSTSYTGFDLILTQTIASAKVRIYGYRQA